MFIKKISYLGYGNFRIKYLGLFNLQQLGFDQMLILEHKNMQQNLNCTAAQVFRGDFFKLSSQQYFRPVYKAILSTGKRNCFQNVKRRMKRWFSKLRR